MDPRLSVSVEDKSVVEKIPYSPAVETKEGHRFIPDDTHAPQGVTGSASFFPWHQKNAVSVAKSKEAIPSSPTMHLKNPADHS